MYKCPRCHSRNLLVVMFAVAAIKPTPLTDDGFECLVTDTTDEIVRCQGCTYTAPIAKFVIDDSPSQTETAEVR